MRRKIQQRGMTLMETLVAVAILAIFSVALYQLYAKLTEVSVRIRVKTIAAQVASEQVEFIRNLQYSDVGTTTGIPSGVVVAAKTVTRNGITFSVNTTIRNVDHIADGTLGGTPNDLSPADNKLIAVEVSCTSCTNPLTIEYTSTVAPKSLETENGNGALVIKAINANGQPVSGATVTIENTALSPQVSITDTTDTYGVLTIVDAPPSVENYKIVVSKSGYSSETTYTPGAAENPNPSKPHLTVSANTVTQSTFAIDQVATIALSLQSPQCAPITGVSGAFLGSKLVGTSPDVYKNSVSFTASSSVNTLNNIEWDTYIASLTGGSYDIVGTNPVFPLSVSPGSTQQVVLTLESASNHRAVVAVVDAAGLPVAGATVEIQGPSGTFSSTSSVGAISQTDWSGGNGQDDFIDTTKFFSNDLGVDYSVAGTVRLANSFGVFLSNGELTSSSIDFGAPATFQQLSFLPTSQPAGVGTTPVRLQLATNTDNSTWNFVGPDGTDQTFYSSSTSDIADIHDGGRYLRYKVLLSTEDTSKTPTVSDIGVTYTAGCLPPGQVDFPGLSSGTYTVTVSKTGYTTTVKDITISGDIYETITISP